MWWPNCAMGALEMLVFLSVSRERQKTMMQSLEQAVKDKQAQYQRLLHENEQVDMMQAV